MPMAASRPFPLGVTPFDGGVDVALHAPDATRVWFCRFNADGREGEPVEITGRTGDVWHGRIAGVGIGTAYGFRVEGPWRPAEGLRFNPAKLLTDPYARRLDSAFRLSDSQFDRRIFGEAKDTADSAPDVPKALVTARPELGCRRAQVAAEDLVIYELNVRAFSKLNPALPEALRGTFAGLGHQSSIDYLGSLGITAVELMPIHAFCDERHLPPLGLANAWGYNPVAWMAPDPRQAPGGWDEVRAAVEALHAAGIAVIVDVVFNHSGESDHLGPTLSLRGIDNRGYYRLADDPAFYVNDAGCGNVLACDRAPVRALVLEALRVMALAGGIDGFRYDLAPILGRDRDGFSADAPLLAEIAADPVLAGLIHIAEPWDIGPGGYRLGDFPAGWGEWNDRFRDTVRRFWRGDAGLIGEFATRFSGSRDLFGSRNRPIFASVNFITAHDGFTLADLVAHETKHNEANGEGNRDGSDTNWSWNNGVEGMSEDAIVRARRVGDIKALLATLVLACGTPMIAMGDERGRSQHGNNNAYAQDNAITWLDWSQGDTALIEFTRRLIALRRAVPALRARQPLTGAGIDETGLADVCWLRPDGTVMRTEDWNDPSCRVLVVALYDGESRAVVAINGTDGELALTLPTARRGFDWRLRLASSDLPARLYLPRRSVAVYVEEEGSAPVGADDAAIGRLAEAVGLAADWWDIAGNRTVVPVESTRALLKGLGLAVESRADVRAALAMLAESNESAALPPTVTVRAGHGDRLALGGRFAAGFRRLGFTVELEGGGTARFTVGPGEGEIEEIRAADGRVVRRRRVPLPELPIGRHLLRWDDDGEISAHLNVVPAAAFRWRLAHGAFGLSAQVYALRTPRTRGIGDFTALEELAGVAARLGASSLGINPLHALLSGHRDNPSPYSPSDRRFIEPVMIDVGRLPAALMTEAVRGVLAAEAGLFAALDQRQMIDYAAVWQAKRAVLDAAFAALAVLGDDHPLKMAFGAFEREGGAALDDYALFEAATGIFGAVPADWPQGLESPAGAGIADFSARHAGAVRGARFRQFLARMQFDAAAAAARAALPLGLYGDLAVGCSPDGGEAWAEQSRLIAGASVGAPPDPFACDGQVWNLPGLNPLTAAAGGFHHFGALMAGAMRGLGVLRIDHVLGLKRLFLVPHGASGCEGAYLRMPFEHLAGHVALESHRHGCAIVGEDLGTVPEGFRDQLAERAMMAMKVVWFERDGGEFLDPAFYPASSVACVSSHDLPPLAGWWSGADISEDRAIGRLSAEGEGAAREERGRERAALLRAITAAGIIVPAFDPDDALPPAVAAAIHAFLVRAGSKLVLVQADDLSNETIALNRPGTYLERPNWRRRLSVKVGELPATAMASAILPVMASRAVPPGYGSSDS